MAEIRINIRNVQAQINQLENAKKELSAQVTILSEILQGIRSSWQGSAADIFASRINDQISEISAIRQEISTVATKIYTVAEYYKQLEHELTLAANKNT